MAKVEKGDIVRITHSGSHNKISYQENELMYVFHSSEDCAYVRFEIDNAEMHTQGHPHTLLVSNEYDVLKPGEYVITGSGRTFTVRKEGLEGVKAGNKYIGGFPLSQLKYDPRQQPECVPYTADFPTIVKAVDGETLLDKAKRLYPAGTKFKCPFSRHDVFTVKGNHQHLVENVAYNIIVETEEKTRSNSFNSHGAAVYDAKTQKWGEIIQDTMLQKIARLYPPGTIFRSPISTHTGVYTVVQGAPSLSPSVGNGCVQAVLGSSKEAQVAVCLVQEGKWAEILAPVGGRILKKFPEEGFCWNIDERLIKYLDDRPYEGSPSPSPKSNAKGIAWSKFSYWYLTTDKGSGKPLYEFEEIEQFLPQLKNKRVEPEKINYFFKLKSEEEYEACKKHLSVNSTYRLSPTWCYLVPSHDNRWVLSDNMPMKGEVLVPLVDKGIIVPGEVRNTNTPVNLMLNKIWIGHRETARVELIRYLEKFGFAFLSTADRTHALNKAMCIYTHGTILTYGYDRVEFDSSTHTEHPLSDYGISSDDAVTNHIKSLENPSVDLYKMTQKVNMPLYTNVGQFDHVAIQKVMDNPYGKDFNPFDVGKEVEFKMRRKSKVLNSPINNIKSITNQLVTRKINHLF